jgi:hypothetical protein
VILIEEGNSSVEFVGVAVVRSADFADALCKNQLVPQILRVLTNIRPDPLPALVEYLRMMIAAMHMLVGVVEWGDADRLILPHDALGAVFGFLR